MIGAEAFCDWANQEKTSCRIGNPNAATVLSQHNCVVFLLDELEECFVPSFTIIVQEIRLTSNQN